MKKSMMVLSMALAMAACTSQPTAPTQQASTATPAGETYAGGNGYAVKVSRAPASNPSICDLFPSACVPGTKLVPATGPSLEDAKYNCEQRESSSTKLGKGKVVGRGTLVIVDNSLRSQLYLVPCSRRDKSGSEVLDVSYASTESVADLNCSTKTSSSDLSLGHRKGQALEILEEKRDNFIAVICARPSAEPPTPGARLTLKNVEAEGVKEDAMVMIGSRPLKLSVVTLTEGGFFSPVVLTGLDIAFMLSDSQPSRCRLHDVDRDPYSAVIGFRTKTCSMLEQQGFKVTYGSKGKFGSETCLQIVTARSEADALHYYRLSRSENERNPLELQRVSPLKSADIFSASKLLEIVRGGDCARDLGLQ